MEDGRNLFDAHKLWTELMKQKTKYENSVVSSLVMFNSPKHDTARCSIVLKIKKAWRIMEW